VPSVPRLNHAVPGAGEGSEGHHDRASSPSFPLAKPLQGAGERPETLNHGGRGVTNYHINVFYSDEDGGYIADIPDLESCSAFGASAAEALAEVEKARDAWLAAARDAGKPIPEPRYRPAIYVP
jgi:predicted RNase H-like HicB family nuclease